MNAIVPLQRYRRDDWVVPCQIQDASGSAIDITGYTIGGELWLPGYGVPSALSVANGGIVRGPDVAGRFTVVAPRLLTANALAALGSTRVLLYWIDTFGRRLTLGVVPFDVFDVAMDRIIDPLPPLTFVYHATTLQLVVSTAQGPPGPSSIGAAQISDGSDLGRSLIKAADAATARAALGVAGIGRSAVNDTTYAVKASDAFVGVIALTAPRILTLPLAANYPQGQPLYVADESGVCGPDRPIVIAAAGQDTIGGQSNVSMQSPFMKLVFHSNGTNLWTV